MMKSIVPAWVKRAPAPAVVLLAGGLSACGSPAARDAARTGQASSPILGGTPATQDRILGTVAIFSTSPLAQECTGTLIAPTVVVTAGHCGVTIDDATDKVTGTVAPSSLVVVAGALDANAAPKSAFFPVAAVVPNPNFPNPRASSAADDTGGSDDLSILILQNPVTTVAVMPVLPASLVPTVMAPGSPVTISGYGTRDQAGALFGQLYTATTPLGHVNTFEFVAGATGSPDTCPGDSGGPVYVQAGGTTYLAGVTSRGVSGTSTAVCGDGGIYELLPAYDDWLRTASAGAYPPSGTPTPTTPPGATPPSPTAGDDGGAPGDDGGAPASGGSPSATGPGQTGATGGIAGAIPTPGGATRLTPPESGHATVTGCSASGAGAGGAPPGSALGMGVGVLALATARRRRPRDG